MSVDKSVGFCVLFSVGLLSRGVGVCLSRGRGWGGVCDKLDAGFRLIGCWGFPCCSVGLSGFWEALSGEVWFSKGGRLSILLVGWARTEFSDG